MISTDRLCGFDYETSGTLPEYALQPWRVAQGLAWPTSLVWVSKAGGTQGGLVPDARMAAEMLRFAIDNRLIMVGWNTVFDIQWLLALGLGDLVRRLKWLDGMLLWRHVFIEPEYDMDRGKKKSYGLKSWVKEYLPQHGDYAEDVDFHDPSPEARAKLHAYNIRDVKFTLTATAWALKQLTPQQLKCALIEAECLPMVAQANLDGMLIDTLAAHELDAKLVSDAENSLTLLQPLGVTEKVVRSPIQLARLLFDEWKLPVLKENTGKKTGKISRATDKEVLHELSFEDPRVKQIRNWREALNNRTKFAQAPLAAAEYCGDGCARPQAIVFGTYSGRLTYASKQGRNKDERQTGFALHQEKRDAVFRAIVVAPPGYTLMEFDASGQEYRWMAIKSGDPVMMELCQPGEDPHGFMGARIVHRDYREMLQAVAKAEKDAKDARQLGKVGNLSLQYRTSARKLRVVARVQYDIPMELPEAQRIWRTYQNTYRKVPTYWQRQIYETKKRGYVETLAGRRVQVKGNWEGSMGWSMESTSINYPIQGTGADQKYLAMRVIKPYLQQINGRFAWDLHDGIYLFIPDEVVPRAAVEIKRMLDSLPYKEAWGFEPPIPLPWDCKVGKSWGTLKEYKVERGA